MSRIASAPPPDASLTVPKAENFEVTVEDVRKETPSVKTFRLRLPGGVPFLFAPGQFMMYHFPDEPKYTRAYSIASSPFDLGFIEITCNSVGHFSKQLFGLNPGAKLIAQGPYGKWIYLDELEHVVLISGGTGITPFRSIARYVIQKKLPNRITMLYSAQIPAELIYREEFDRYSKQPNFKIFNTVTRHPDPQRWSGWTGRIDLKKIKAAVPDFSTAHYYMCGPNGLIRDLSEALHAEGIPRAHIRYEKWGEF